MCTALVAGRIFVQKIHLKEKFGAKNDTKRDHTEYLGLSTDVDFWNEIDGDVGTWYDMGAIFSCISLNREEDNIIRDYKGNEIFKSLQLLD